MNLSVHLIFMCLTSGSIWVISEADVFENKMTDLADLLYKSYIESKGKLLVDAFLENAQFHYILRRENLGKNYFSDDEDSYNQLKYCLSAYWEWYIFCNGHSSLKTHADNFMRGITTKKPISIKILQLFSFWEIENRYVKKFIEFLKNEESGTNNSSVIIGEVEKVNLEIDLEKVFQIRVELAWKIVEFPQGIQKFYKKLFEEIDGGTFDGVIEEQIDWQKSVLNFIAGLSQEFEDFFKQLEEI
ncbi:uncharacterized protein LOC120354004 isoform X3 [Nilaparvata lugens]|uniref:uncharacterized protein LOC120354004 isoform X3 n=1 Tax=Nilaparvata lugens TaxID=108931 RepID=UPI00193DC131|nr:uncharacterized protein LOC120354004 isoform X3 [Nilaparvata lugens]XP_039295678.1 uncharacterized protein LOC120354004 isoform X3 [Nilaparvata lugens]